MNKLMIRMVMIFLLLGVFISSATARDDDCVFYFEPNEISIAPGEEVVVYLNLDAPVNMTSTFQANVVFDPNIVECVDVIIPNASVTDWMATHFWGVFPTNDDREYIFFDALDFSGQGPGQLRCGDMILKGVNPGVSTLFVGFDEISDGDNQSLVGDMDGNLKDWTTETLTFTCTGPADTFDKTLVTGWNLVSLPLTPPDNSLAAVLASIDGNYDAVKSYNAATNAFEDPTTMDPGTGYFIHMTAEDIWSYEGETFNSLSESLTTGLNCVGWENTNASLPDALNSIDYRYVSRWNADDQKYEVYDVNAPTDFNDFDMMERGEGYFIAATADCTLSP